MKLLFNPFEKFRENHLLIAGTILTVTGSFLAYIFTARYDGVLDMHFTNAVSWYEPFLDNCINIACASLVFFLAGYLINKKTRFVDVLAFYVVARLPLYITVFFNACGYLASITDKIIQDPANNVKLIGSADMIFLAIFGLVSLLFIVWYFALMYNAYRVASNAKGAKAIVLFIIAVIAAEIISKTLIGFTL